MSRSYVTVSIKYLEVDETTDRYHTVHQYFALTRVQETDKSLASYGKLMEQCEQIINSIAKKAPQP